MNMLDVVLGCGIAGAVINGITLLACYARIAHDRLETALVGAVTGAYFGTAAGTVACWAFGIT